MASGGLKWQYVAIIATFSSIHLNMPHALHVRKDLEGNTGEETTGHGKRRNA